eukprot:4669809-Pyramimonas_sp.AAC.1
MILLPPSRPPPFPPCPPLFGSNPSALFCEDVRGHGNSANRARMPESNAYVMKKPSPSGRASGLSRE